MVVDCTEESKSSHLDVFLTNCSFAFTDVLVKPIGFSDHHVVARRTHPLCAHKVIHARSYRKLDSNLICNLFTDKAWDAVFPLTMLVILYCVSLLCCRVRFPST